MYTNIFQQVIDEWALQTFKGTVVKTGSKGGVDRHFIEAEDGSKWVAHGYKFGDKKHVVGKTFSIARNSYAGLVKVKEFPKHIDEEVEETMNPFQLVIDEAEKAEQIDELKKSTLLSYIDKSVQDIGARGAATRELANKSRDLRDQNKHKEARETMAKADKVFNKGWKRKQGVSLAAAKLASGKTTNEDITVDEGTFFLKTSADAKASKEQSNANAAKNAAWRFAQLQKKHAAEKEALAKKQSGEKSRIKEDTFDKDIKDITFRKATDEKVLTPAEKDKREEIAKAMERENPGMDMGKKMAIATAAAKRAVEEHGDLAEVVRVHSFNPHATRTDTANRVKELRSRGVQVGKTGKSSEHGDVAITKESIDEGWGADTHNTAVVAHNRAWEAMHRKWAHHEGMTATLKKHRYNNWKASAAEEAAKKKHPDAQPKADESVQIDELSSETLASYKKKAGEAASKHDQNARYAHKLSGTGETHGDKVMRKHAETETGKANKRYSGILRATRQEFKKANEEVFDGDATKTYDALEVKKETVNEISKDTVQSYKDKAEKEVKETKPWTKKGEYKDIAKRIVARREKGIDAAKKKLGEETLDEISKEKVAAYADKAMDDMEAADAKGDDDRAFKRAKGIQRAHTKLDK